MAQKCEMKLLGNRGSAFVSRVKFALKLKGLEYEYIEEDLLNKSELLLTSNPVFQLVPVLFHENKQPMFESLAILEYLDEIKPDVHPLLPSNPSERAQCRILAYTFDTLYIPRMKVLMLTQEKERREELAGPFVEAFALLEEVFIKMSKGKAYFGGDDIGYLDVVIGSFVGWCKFIESAFGVYLIDKERTPRFAEWAKRIWSHEVARSVIPGQEMYKNFLNYIIKQSKWQPMSVTGSI